MEMRQEREFYKKLWKPKILCSTFKKSQTQQYIKNVKASLEILVWRIFLVQEKLSYFKLVLKSPQIYFWKAMNKDCCIFWPAFWCCTISALFEIFFSCVFCTFKILVQKLWKWGKKESFTKSCENPKFCVLHLRNHKPNSILRM